VARARATPAEAGAAGDQDVIVIRIRSLIDSLPGDHDFKEAG
jgi:hypothetical protein